MNAAPKRARLIYLDDGRALACLMVVLYHAIGTVSLDKYFGYNSAGQYLALSRVRMPFFFAMSGFLLSWFTLNRPQFGLDPGLQFLRKKILRIYPLYLVMLAAMCLLLWLNNHQLDDGGTLLSNITLWPRAASHQYGGLGGTALLILYPAWTLQFEMAAILLLTLCLFSRRFYLIYLFAFPVMNMLFKDSAVFALNFWGSDWLLIFWFGVVAAQLARIVSVQTKNELLFFASLFLLGLLAVQWMTAHGRVDPNLDMDNVYGMVFALLMIGLSQFTTTQTQHTLYRRVVMKASGWSYAIFLAHAPVISLVCKALVRLGFTSPEGWWLALAVTLALAVAVGAAIHHWIELPLQRWLKPGAASVLKGATA